MVEMQARYTGELHCELKHGPSGTQIETDAPVDNQGRGQSFSPTDLVGAALASCVLTTMAIMGERDGMKLVGSHARIQKAMSASPRKIESLTLELHLPKSLNETERKKLETIAHACPVSRSLHPDVKIPTTFHYDVG